MRELINSYNVFEKERVSVTKGFDKKNWNVYRDSTLTNILSSFSTILPYGYRCNYAPLIEGIFEEKRGRVVLLEMGGPARNLASTFSDGFLKKSAGCTLRKGLSRDIKNEKPFSHKIIIGDMFLTETKQKIKKWLDGDKVDILIERMMGGLYTLPQGNPFWFWKQLNDWYTLLSEEGIMFVQSYMRSVGSDTKNLLVSNEIFDRWKELVSKNKSLVFQSDEYNQFFYIKKLIGSPKRLPII